MKSIKILFIADTHLGFDMPMQPRIERARRGQDFFDNFERALQPAFQHEVDMVIHGGDLFYRTRVPARLIDMVMTPLSRLAETGMPIYIVPGNHERSRLPLYLWAEHENMHIFKHPTTFVQQMDKVKIAIAGFPFTRQVRDQFSQLVDQTNYKEIQADFSLLCIHQAVEGAQVGAVNYTFKQGPDVVRAVDIPRGFDVVLAGHIHRAQHLDRDLSRQTLNSSVIYAGAIERTSFAERNEAKGYVLLTLDISNNGSKSMNATNVWLPVRPMIRIELNVNGLSKSEIKQQIQSRLQKIPSDSVVRIELKDAHARERVVYIPLKELRELAPANMIISSHLPDSLYKHSS